MVLGVPEVPRVPVSGLLPVTSGLWITRIRLTTNHRPLAADPWPFVPGPLSLAPDI